MAHAEEMARAGLKEVVALQSSNAAAGFLDIVFHCLHTQHRQTKVRAELQAMIHGLELAIEKRNALDLDPYLILTMKSDSRYAVDCMNVWINNWRQNGWVNSKGYEVVNRDLITRIDDLWDEIIDGAGSGKVVFRWIPREQNSFADKLANDALDEGSE